MTAIRTTLPTGPGQRHRRIWALVGKLKALPLKWTPAERMIAIREWHRLALPTIKTKAFAETLADYLTAWANRKHPAGAGFVDAIRKAAAGPCPRIADELEIGDKDTRGLMTLLANLQALIGEPFFLSCRHAAGELGIGKSKANDLLRMLVGLNVLKIVTPGKRGKPGDPATVWRWVGG
jgi:hypothetical protein